MFRYSSAMTSDGAAMPVSVLYLLPLYIYALWLALIIRAAVPWSHPGLGRRHVVERVDVPLQLGDDLRWSCAACLGLVLVAVEHIRVVARRDHGGAGRLAVDHCP